MVSTRQTLVPLDRFRFAKHYFNREMDLNDQPGHKLNFVSLRIARNPSVINKTTRGKIMSSGHASHKGVNTKTTNQNGVIDANPGDTPTEADYSRDDQEVTPVNPAATERPEDSSTENQTSEQH